ncbi:MAG: PAS domain S-box protein, partial [Pseudomonadota bacterium]
VTSGEQGYYASLPVRDGRNEIIGVAVIKRSMSDLEGLFPPEAPAVIIDAHGVVVLANQPDMFLKSLWPMSAEVREQLIASRQFGPGPFAPILAQAPVDGGDCRFQGRPYLILRQPLPFQDWSTVILSSPRPIAVARLQGLSIAILSCLAVLSMLTIIGMTIESTSRVQRSENRFRQLSDNLRDGSAVVDMSGNIVEWNPAFQAMLGYPPEELVKLSLRDLSPETRQEQEARIIAEQVLPRGYSDLYEQEYRRRDGSVLPVELQTYLVREDGEQPAGMWVFVRDVTERKRAEEAFQVLVNKAPMGIFIAQDGKFKIINPGFLKICGYSEEELIGRSSLILVAPDYREDVRRNAIRMLKGESLLPYEFPFITKNGETRWVVEKVASTVYQGKRAALGYFLDITEQKGLESQFLQAEKMEAIGTLAGGIAHDFNNILTAILGNIGLAVLDDKIGPRVQDRLAQAEEACLRAQALSQQLLTFAKGGAPVKKLFSVAELLTESTAFACVGSQVRCETDFPENLWSLEGDPGQIGQVFQNLTINAVQALPTGGTIKVWAENLTLGTDSGLPLSAGRYIKISVRDQGMGIPAEHLPRIFDPYFTTKQKGSGLGLASAYAIVNKHHGHIAVESKPGVGTIFHIYLPAVEGQVAPQPEKDREILVGKGKILVMDDEEMVREVLGRILARLGYEPGFARDGGEAIEMFVQAHGFGQAFAAVILDLTVPGGMGGKETVERLLEVDPRVKAVVSSGYSDDPVMADFQKYGFSGVIAKPYRISELGKILHEVIIKKI